MVLKKQFLAAWAVALLFVALCAYSLTFDAKAAPAAVHTVSEAGWDSEQASAPAFGTPSSSAASSTAARTSSSGISFAEFPSFSVQADNPLLYDASWAWMPEVEISEYDDVLRRLGAVEGVDWRLLSAIAYHESRFRCNLVSPAGARGLMQVRPVVARHFNVSVTLLGDLETNITLAAKLIRTVESKLNLPTETAPRDRLSLVLACYNAGDSHVAVARKLAELNGADPNSWHSVSRFLRRGQTNAFVRQVLDSYSEYCMMTAI